MAEIPPIPGGEPPPPAPTPAVGRDWRLWADATCAGLSVLIPVPLLDLVFEGIFRRRIPVAVARTRGHELAPEVVRELGRGTWDLVGGCLAMAFKIIKYLLRRIWRKLIYVFTIADAVDAVSAYWHRAFLVDHLLRRGHLDPDSDLEQTMRVFTTTLAGADVSGVKALARQVVTGVGHVPRLLSRARRRGATGVTAEVEAIVAAHWQVMEASLVQVAHTYDRLHAESVSARSTEGSEG